MALPEDSDAEGCEETVKEGFPENYEEEISYAVVDTPEIIDTSSDDAILPANVLPTAYHVEGYLLEDKFCNITMNKIYKLFLASTFHMSDVERNQLTGRRVQYSTPRGFREACTRNFLVCWDHCVWSFAIMITESMRHYYRETGDLTVDLATLRAKSISYPNSGPLCTIGDLIEHPQNAYAFLLRLTGEKGPRIESFCTSPCLNFYSERDTTCTRPFQSLKDMVVDIILPYAVTYPLIRMARASRGRSKFHSSCNKNNYSNKATQYLLDPLVEDKSNGRKLTPLKEMQSRDPLPRASKRRRLTRSEHHVSPEHAIEFTPYSASKAVRSGRNNESAGTHLFHTACTTDELSQSYGKCRNFRKRFYNTF